MSDIDAVAEAIWGADDLGPAVWDMTPATRARYLRMAQCAIGSLQLKEEKRNIRSICDMADTAGIDKRRWVSPWVRVEGVTA